MNSINTQKKESVYDRLTETKDLVSVIINYPDNTRVEIYWHQHPASDDIKNLLRIIIKNNDEVEPEDIENKDA